MLGIFEIWIFYIFEFCGLSKVISPLSKKPIELDGDDNNNKVYLYITVNFYTLVHVIIRLDG